VAYINLVIEHVATVKDAQALVWHATPDLTMNVYGRTRDERLAQGVEQLSEAVQPVKRVPMHYQREGDIETENATTLEDKQLRQKRNGGAEGNQIRDLSVYKTSIHDA